MVCLVVRMRKKKIYCHSLLLAFYSGYFNGKFNSGSGESQTSEFVVMWDFDAEAMDIFVAWAYTGHIVEGKIAGVKLWVLGDRLLSPLFTNEVMYLLISLYHLEITNALDVGYAMRSTAENSKLRIYMKDLFAWGNDIREFKRLRDRDPDDDDKAVPDYLKDRVKDWSVLLKEGGDFILEVLILGFNRADATTKDLPSYWRNQKKYLKPYDKRSAKDFIRDKPRTGT